MTYREARLFLSFRIGTRPRGFQPQAYRKLYSPPFPPYGFHFRNAEVLDPEQNNAFHDNYLDVDYDLSKVMFIATANNINTIPAPLLDRMELIEVSGYITEEKIEIAKRHLIPKEMEANGLKKGSLSISKAVIALKIRHVIFDAYQNCRFYV